MNCLGKNDNELFQNSISFLHNISSLTSTPPALKCVYLTKARLMELRTNIQVPSNTTRTTVRCQKCFLNLIDGPAKYKIKPEEKKSNFSKKMLVKIREGKPMTKYQRNYIKRLNRFSGNQLAIGCKFCKKESLVKLEKPKKLPTKVVKATLKRRKKIKKKDKFCGLNEEVVLSVTSKKLKKVDVPESAEISQETSGRKLAGFKLSKTKILESCNKEDVITKTDIRKNSHQLKNKNKLKDFLCTKSSVKSNNTPKLKHFLQSL